MRIKVIYANPQNGRPHDKDLCSAVLVEGQEYTVTEIERTNWHTSFWLEEVQGHHFNSVMFDEVEEGSLQCVYDELPAGYHFIPSASE